MSEALNNFVNKKIRSITRMIQNAVTRFVLDGVDDSKKMQEVKVEIMDEEIKEGIERFQNFGFTSSPPAGSEGIALSTNGNRDNTVVIVIDNREKRLKGLSPGESAMYNAFGQFIKVKADGTVQINCTKLEVNATSTAEFNTPLVKASQLISAQTDVTVLDENTGIGNIKSIYNSHTHDENSDTITDPPNQPI